MLCGCRITSSPSARATATVSSSLASSTTMTSSTMSRGRARHVASSVRPAWYAGMTTTMRLPRSIGRDLIPVRDGKHDDMGILENRRSERLAQDTLARRRLRADRLAASLADAHVGLLPCDIVDVVGLQRIAVGQVHGIGETISRIARQLPIAALDAQSGEIAGHDRLHA